MCLRQGYVPDDLKVARVTPIYKSGSKEDFSNRPISILPICSKILKKIVHKQLYMYLTDNQLTWCTMGSLVFVSTIRLALPVS